MDFMKEYEKWLASPALSDAERAELESIRNDPKAVSYTHLTLPTKLEV